MQSNTIRYRKAVTVTEIWLKCVDFSYGEVFVTYIFCCCCIVLHICLLIKLNQFFGITCLNKVLTDLLKFFCTVFMDCNVVKIHEHTTKRLRPTSSPLNYIQNRLGWYWVYNMVQRTTFSTDNTAGNPDVRWGYLAHSLCHSWYKFGLSSLLVKLTI